VEAVLDELYTTPPAHFVPRREELAAAARTAGRAEDARRIHAARRPTLGAWAANLLLRSEPQESRRFLELGDALREAHRTLDPGGIKELSAQRRRIVSALSRQAAQLALDAGHRLSDTVQRDVESTLNAVLADPDAAGRWATGRLHSTLTPPAAFPSGSAAPAGTRQKAGRPGTPPPSPRARHGDELAERRRAREEKLAQARGAAEEAEQRLRDRRTEHADAESLLEETQGRRDRAQQRVGDAEQRLRQEREILQQADREHGQARRRLRTAADALARAEREAEETAREVERLGGRRAR
jgi:hypothetical protein